MGLGRLWQHNFKHNRLDFGENYAGIIGTFSHLNGNNRLDCTCTQLYSVQYSSKQYRGYKFGNTLVGHCGM